MARKKRISKKDILQAGFDIAKENGFADITARKVAKKMSCSVAPIYFNFKDIEELKEYIILKAIFEFEKIFCEQQTESILLDYEITSVIFAKEFPLFYDEIIIKKHPLFKTVERIKNYGLVQLKNEPKYKYLDSEALLQIQLKKHIFQEGLALVARDEKYASVFTKEYIVELLQSASNNFCS